MKTPVHFDAVALFSWVKLAGPGHSLTFSVTNHGESFMMMGCLFLSRAHSTLGTATLDLEQLGWLIQIMSCCPALHIDGAHFDFRIPSPLKDEPNGKSLFSGSLTPEIREILAQGPFVGLPKSVRREAVA